MVGLIRALATLGKNGLEGLVNVGGVAVAARLGHAHRATTDVDTVMERVPIPKPSRPLAHPNAEPDPTGGHRVGLGVTKVEIIGVGPVDDNSTTA